MQAKIFDPYDEARVEAWLAEPPVKLVLSTEMFDTTQGGVARRVALVFYDEERTVHLHVADLPEPKRRAYVFGDEEQERRRHG
jgi:hypothetical protein